MLCEGELYPHIHPIPHTGLRDPPDSKVASQQSDMDIYEGPSSKKGGQAELIHLLKFEYEFHVSTILSCCMYVTGRVNIFKLIRLGGLLMHAGLNPVLVPSSRTWPGNERVSHHHSMRMHFATYTLAIHYCYNVIIPFPTCTCNCPIPLHPPFLH